MKILGLDISSSVIGWAIIQKKDDSLNLLNYGNIKPLKSSKGNMTERLDDAFVKIKKLLKEETFDDIAVEQYANKFSKGRSSARTIIVLSSFNEVVCLACYQEKNITPHKISPATIRKNVGKHFGEKIVSKEDAFELITKNFKNFKITKNRNLKIRKEHYDESDAICVAISHLLEGRKCQK
ncbi:crossover junction endodeoxyribonuclease RuvC [bacterium]|nr:crossover junction endodeoxyribonuclease RuvC [bacterium]